MAPLAAYAAPGVVRAVLTESTFETVLILNLRSNLVRFCNITKVAKTYQKKRYVFHTFLMLKMRQYIKYVPNLDMYLVRI